MQSIIQPYNPEWPQQFEEIRKLICEAVHPVPVSVLHVGSTAVPGLSAKPIIDIDLVYASIDQSKSISERLQSIGYSHVGDQGIKGREVFKRTDHNHPVLDRIPHHLYVNHFESGEWRRHMQFRDHLIRDVAGRNAYQQLKLDIAEQAGGDRKRYAQLKEAGATAFIENILNPTQDPQIFMKQ